MRFGGVRRNGEKTEGALPNELAAADPCKGLGDFLLLEALLSQPRREVREIYQVHGLVLAGAGEDKGIFSGARVSLPTFDPGCRTN